jgi:hypothetical protein
MPTGFMSSGSFAEMDTAKDTFPDTFALAEVLS